jgi:hypothetical protein
MLDMDDIALFDTALSVDQIRNVMNGRESSEGPPTKAIVPIEIPQWLTKGDDCKK